MAKPTTYAKASPHLGSATVPWATASPIRPKKWWRLKSNPCPSFGNFKTEAASGSTSPPPISRSTAFILITLVFGPYSKKREKLIRQSMSEKIKKVE